MRVLEQEMAHMSREEASKSRATHIKLTRDYRWVEQKFKNLLLEYKQKRNALEAERRMAIEEENRKKFGQGIDDETHRMQMQLKDDVSYSMSDVFCTVYNANFLIKDFTFHLASNGRNHARTRRGGSENQSRHASSKRNLQGTLYSLSYVCVSCFT